jgi:hypothetical protein
MNKVRNEEYEEKEAQARFEAALRGGLNTPHKPLKDKPKVKTDHGYFRSVGFTNISWRVWERACRKVSGDSLDINSIFPIGQRAALQPENSNRC